MSPASTLSIDFAAVTDVGCIRSNNEDSYGFDAYHHLYVVCDGMGGYAAGEVASGLAVRTMIDTFASSAEDVTTSSEPLEIEKRLMAAILAANRAVYEAGANNPALQSMGTTLVCACLEGDRAVVGNVGDSRAYLIRGGACHQITQDHSFIEEQIRAGNLLSEQAALSNMQSVITRAIGVDLTVEPDLFGAQLQPEDMLLLASDGLTRYARPEDIVVATGEGLDLSGTCRVLIDFAKRSGGADNITCVLVRAAKMPPQQTLDEKLSGQRTAAREELGEEESVARVSTPVLAPVPPAQETDPTVPVSSSNESLGEWRLNDSHI